MKPEENCIYVLTLKPVKRWGENRMAYGIDSNDDALLALSNFYEELVEYAIAANPQISDVDSPMGSGVAFFQLVTEMRDSYGDEAVAIALERTRSSMNIACQTRIRSGTDTGRGGSPV